LAVRRVYVFFAVQIRRFTKTDWSLPAENRVNLVKGPGESDDFRINALCPTFLVAGVSFLNPK